MRPLGEGSVAVRTRMCVIVWEMGAGGALASHLEPAEVLPWVMVLLRCLVLDVTKSAAYSEVAKEGGMGLCEEAGREPVGLRAALMPHAQ